MGASGFPDAPIDFFMARQLCEATDLVTLFKKNSQNYYPFIFVIF